MMNLYMQDATVKLLRQKKSQAHHGIGWVIDALVLISLYGKAGGDTRAARAFMFGRA